MKKIIYFFAVTFILSFTTKSVFGQGMAINTTGSASDASAMLDVASTSKGVLVPRMTGAQKWAITSPATGLMIYQTDSVTGFYYYTGSAWSAVGGSAAPVLTTTGITALTNSTATSGGYIISSGAAVTAYGVCWGTSPGPTVLGSHTTDGSGVASFTSSITGLTGNTTYYVSAYATTGAGTVYGTVVSFTTLPAIGSAYGGGVLAYVFQPGDPGYSPVLPHGLIAATTNQSTGIQWYNGSYTITYATDTAIGTGFSNTMAIIANQGAGSYAATVARSYTGGGYNDWYLPSKDELNELYINMTVIGGFSSVGYWSSSEFDNINVWYEDFCCGFQVIAPKSSPTTNVRAVRAF